MGDRVGSVQRSPAVGQGRMIFCTNQHHHLGDACNTCVENEAEEVGFGGDGSGEDDCSLLFVG
jgi:hypothetical protein